MLKPMLCCTRTFVISFTLGDGDKKTEWNEHPAGGANLKEVLVSFVALENVCFNTHFEKWSKMLNEILHNIGPLK